MYNIGFIVNVERINIENMMVDILVQNPTYPSPEGSAEQVESTDAGRMEIESPAILSVVIENVESVSLPVISGPSVGFPEKTEMVFHAEYSGINHPPVSNAPTNIFPQIRKGKWLPEEREKLVGIVSRYSAQYGTTSRFPSSAWNAIATELGSRTTEQVAHQWRLTLNPSIKKGSWTDEEDKILKEKIREVGSEWTEIAKSIPGRTGKQVTSRAIHLSLYKT